jgi:hypothetical protein
MTSIRVAFRMVSLSVSLCILSSVGCSKNNLHRLEFDVTDASNGTRLSDVTVDIVWRPNQGSGNPVLKGVFPPQNSMSKYIIVDNIPDGGNVALTFSSRGYYGAGISVVGNWNEVYFHPIDEDYPTNAVQPIESTRITFDTPICVRMQPRSPSK